MTGDITSDEDFEYSARPGKEIKMILLQLLHEDAKIRG